MAKLIKGSGVELEEKVDETREVAEGTATANPMSTGSTLHIPKSYLQVYMDFVKTTTEIKLTGSGNLTNHVLEDFTPLLPYLFFKENLSLGLRDVSKADYLNMVPQGELKQLYEETDLANFLPDAISLDQPRHVTEVPRGYGLDSMPIHIAAKTLVDLSLDVAFLGGYETLSLFMEHGMLMGDFIRYSSTVGKIAMNNEMILVRYAQWTATEDKTRRKLHVGELLKPENILAYVDSTGTKEITAMVLEAEKVASILQNVDLNDIGKDLYPLLQKHNPHLT
jgi:hypothetical protein